MTILKTIFDLPQIMQQYKINILGNINFNITGRAQRFKSADKSRGGKDIFVFLHEDQGATFGDWHDTRAWHTWWVTDRKQVSATYLREFEQRRLEREVQRAKKINYAIKRAERFYNRPYTTAYCDMHPYIQIKRIRGLYSKQVIQFKNIKDTLLIPIRDVDYNFKGLQIIKANGFKRFWRGTSQKNNMIWLSDPLKKNYDDVIRVCEGWSTGCTIYEAIGAPVICALAASNLISVAVQLKRKYPHAIISIYADNDQFIKENVGLISAREACLLTGASLFYPDFTGLDVTKKPTDFNDLLCLTAIEEVENQLNIKRK